MYLFLIQNCERKAAETKNEQMQNNGAPGVFPGVVHNGQHIVHTQQKKGPMHIQYTGTHYILKSFL